MNKEEYREEVLRQLKEQNTHLKEVVVLLWFALFLVIIMLIVVVYQGCHIKNIEHYVSKMYIADIPSKILSSVEYIEDKLELIYTTIRYK